jgi:hypothetical protein
MQRIVVSPLVLQFSFGAGFCLLDPGSLLLTSNLERQDRHELKPFLRLAFSSDEGEGVGWLIFVGCEPEDMSSMGKILNLLITFHGMGGKAIRFVVAAR